MFLDNKKHKNLAFPAGEGADQLLRREADEGYAQAASSVRQQTDKLQGISKNLSHSESTESFPPELCSDIVTKNLRIGSTIRAIFCLD